MNQTKYIVLKKDTALNMGSGTLDVLATPSAIAMAENNCMKSCQYLVTSEETTVGIGIDFKHIKPSLVGAVITVSSKIKEHDNKKITFIFEMFDGKKKIAYGEHQRVIVNTSSFLSHIE